MRLAQFVPLLVIVALFWVLVLRPARKRQREAATLQGGLRTGSKVMLTSGIFGTVTALHDATVLLEVAPSTSIEVSRQAVARVVPPAGSEVDPTSRPSTEPSPETTTDSDDDR